MNPEICRSFSKNPVFLIWGKKPGFYQKNWVFGKDLKIGYDDAM